MTDVVGLIPAAGMATRLAPLPGSKEMLPIGFKSREREGRRRPCPKPVSEYLIERMCQGGAQRIYVVLSNAKWDMIRYYADGSSLGVHMAYIYLERSPSMPYTLNAAFPWLVGHDATVLFGMPDTLFWPSDAYSQLLATHRERGADLTLGVFPTDQPERLSVVEMDNAGCVLSVTDKPAHPRFNNTWGIACWGPRFSELLNASLAGLSAEHEVVLADVFQAALERGMRVHARYFEQGEYIDIGVEEDLYDAVRRFCELEGDLTE